MLLTKSIFRGVLIIYLTGLIAPESSNDTPEGPKRAADPLWERACSRRRRVSRYLH
ncbi:hypothetical protein PMI36_03171 [Pseudomonas sp. GM79]|nr:hypothetical protein PMI36_03171 [Pseudomonas sp. GM79]